MSKTATRISKVGTVVVPVTDQERAIAFYVDTLGFEKRADVPFGEGYRWVEVGPAGAETTIAIVPPPPGNPTGNVQTGIGLNTDDIDALHAELQGARRRRRRRGQPHGRPRPAAVLVPRPRRQHPDGRRGLIAPRPPRLAGRARASRGAGAMLTRGRRASLRARRTCARLRRSERG